MKRRTMRVIILEEENIITAQYNETTEEDIIIDIISTIIKTTYNDMDKIKEIENAIDYYVEEITEIIKKVKQEVK